MVPSRRGGRHGVRRKPPDARNTRCESRPSMRSSFPVALTTGLVLVALTAPGPAAAADWPQFMGNAAHTGDAAGETLRLPLGLATCVRLDDAVTTSPAVVGRRVYVVDQMGTAYCIDPQANRVLWKATPDGPRARGANTSSPCVAAGRVCYGTTAGTFHILDAATGKVVKSLDLGWPITGSPTWA